MSKLTESHIETLTIDLLQQTGWQYTHGLSIAPGAEQQERESFEQVLLTGRLLKAVSRINPGIPAEACMQAIQQAQRIYSPELLYNNETFHRLLVEKIKNIIQELIHYSNEQLQINFSEHLSKTLEYDYTYLAYLFSEMETMPIQKYIIIQKIERVKQLTLDDELTLTEIAWKLHYSSVAHLSNQFKKVTGLTPSLYKQQKHNSNATLQNV